MSEGSTTALTLLDLSAAFDTIDHSILFHRLHECYGINGLALSWFESYLSDRTQSVKVGSVLSHPMDLKFGFPQGSVLGPLVFSMYTNPLSSIIQSHRGIKHHFYADDTQLYITLSPSNFSQSMTALTDCLNDIQNFMAFMDKLHPYTSSRNTRRSSPKYKFLQVPSFDSKIHKSHKYLTKSFSHHAPVFWNSLPVHVRTSPSVTSFRKHLKTHLFKPAFPT